MTPAIELASLREASTGLARPECVLCLADGGLLLSHLGAGVLHLAPDGTRRAIGAAREVDGQPFVPNGFALMPDGGLLVANMGPGGGVWRIDAATGAVRAELREVDGLRLPATNFVLADGERAWVSVSTRQWPISNAFSAGVADGFVALLDGQGARIVADGLAFANELRIDAGRQYLYGAETFAHRISRYRLTGGGAGSTPALGPRELFADLGADHYPDGLAFDAEGGLWVASIISNRVLRVSSDGAVALMVDDCDAAALRAFQARLRDGAVTRDDVQSRRGARLTNPSSIAFGGPDLKTAYVGSLGGDTVYAFRTPVAGLAPPHWGQGFGTGRATR